ncbi:MAG: LPS export ABC transporter permease LptF [Candidatus Tectomicrobia bacterium]|uniref:LPS export ABC transporter permease LptF n=1 Tax=Tectimicrobiota bacterium TaxID=2528274 RepID=A0A932CNZ2_UNCTE|nr:LPS export ABC transporter permease LptF [Candidatus Tectomicrobia bacterium]
MRIIPRYIFREIASTFALSLIIFTFILLLGKMAELIEMVFSRGVPLLQVAQLLLFILPPFAVVTIPISVGVSCTVVFSRLSTDGEILALKASGISLYHLLIPVGLFSAMAAALVFFLITFAQPWGNSAFKAALVQLLQTQTQVELKERIFNDRFKGLVIYVNEIPRGTQTLKGIMIADSRNLEAPETIFATGGSLTALPGSSILSLKLQDGTIHRFYAKRNRYQLLRFSRYEFSLDLQESFGEKGKGVRRAKEMSLFELRSRLQGLRRKSHEAYQLLTELHKKFTTPYACLILGLIGAPLGIRNQRSGRSGGFALSALLLFCYYLFSLMGEGLAEKGSLPPLVALWGPNLLWTLAGGYILYQMGRERPLFGLEQIGRPLEGRGQEARRALTASAERLRQAMVRQGERCMARLRRHPIGASSERPQDRPYRALPPGHPGGAGPQRLPQRMAPPPRWSLAYPWRTRILNRYVLSRFLQLFLLILAAFVLLYLVVEVVGKIEAAVEHQASLWYVLAYFTYELPHIVLQVLPFALLISSILTFALLSRNNELTAMRAGGISLTWISYPLILFGLVASLATFCGNEFILPHTNQQAALISRTQIKKRAVKGIFKNSKIWYHGGDHSLWNIQLLHPRQRLMHGITLFRMDPQSRLRERWDATEARWQAGEIFFHQAHLRTFGPNGSFEVAYFPHKRIRSSERLQDFLIIQKDPQEMSLR